MTTAVATLTAPQEMSLGQAAEAAGLKEWQLVSLLRRGLVDEPKRFGRYRVFTPENLPRIRDAAVRAGYLDAESAA
jgi:DNA-binding transcriptional MerR regulator